MRAPLSAIEPASSGVSIFRRGESASTCSRVIVGAAAGWPGACGVVPGGAWVVGAGAGVVPGGACGFCCVCCCCGCCSFCFCICGRPTKICHPISTSADSTMARSVFF